MNSRLADVVTRSGPFKTGDKIAALKKRFSKALIFKQLKRPYGFLFVDKTKYCH